MTPEERTAIRKECDSLATADDAWDLAVLALPNALDAIDRLEAELKKVKGVLASVINIQE